MSSEELIGGDVILFKLSTNIGISQTRPKFSPIGRAGDSVPKPIRERVESVLFVIAIGHLVKGKETLLVPVSTNEADE